MSLTSSLAKSLVECADIILIVPELFVHNYELKFMAEIFNKISLVMRKAAFCNCADDQRLCFRYTDSTIPSLPKSEISSL